MSAQCICDVSTIYISRYQVCANVLCACMCVCVCVCVCVCICACTLCMCVCVSISVSVYFVKRMFEGAAWRHGTRIYVQSLCVHVVTYCACMCVYLRLRVYVSVNKMFESASVGTQHILKSHLATRFAMQNDDSDDFWEILRSSSSPADRAPISGSAGWLLRLAVLEE